LLSTYETAVERNRELASARDDLRHLNDTLEGKVVERTAALEIEIAERRRAEGEVRRLNAELEQRVQQRTLQLETMNQELEAFSYSVSHDLRTPLRHIAGFAGMLGKRCGSQLNEQGRGYLETINESVAKMGRLIEDLLEFSRMSRIDLQHSAVDLTSIVTEIQRDLEIEAGDRKINWLVESMPLVRADPAMMRQVFANLLGNAVKYTRTRERAEITVGAKPTANEIVFFVRDNGVGFDMKYAANLFGVFQRLHRADEFEGTGIGLANVRRIIARHGGRTWAEAKVEEGATFYVTLPALPESQRVQRVPG
jgi:light-regulated signal transduction histidine kinase (bacteriophytochrome)